MTIFAKNNVKYVLHSNKTILRSLDFLNVVEELELVNQLNVLN